MQHGKLVPVSCEDGEAGEAQAALQRAQGVRRGCRVSRNHIRPVLGSLDLRKFVKGGDMEAIQISSQWYVVRWEDKSRAKFTIVSGPYQEQWWAISACRLNEI